MSDSTQYLFEGLRILDLTKVLSGPLATRYFADYGAQVIKIEQVNAADPGRNFPPLVQGWSGYFEVFNRNKKGITLDLTNERDRQSFFELVKTADVIVENLTPSVKKKLQISYQDLVQVKPDIIYASLAGIDQDTNRKYFDLIAQAESGLLSLSGTPDQPGKIGPAVVDAFAGTTLAFGIAGALFHRQRTGVGQEVSVSMLGCAMNLLEQNLIEYSVTKKNPVRPGNHDTAIAPFGVFQTKDAFIALAIGSDSLWLEFVQLFTQESALSASHFATNAGRLTHLTELVTTIERLFSQFDVAELLALLRAHNIPAAMINEMSDVATDEWFRRSKALVDFTHRKAGVILVPGEAVHFASHPMRPLSAAPAQGEDNEEFGIHH